MQNDWKYVKPLQDVNAVNDFLAANNIELPASLVGLLICYNGGRPAKKDFVSVEGREYVFKSLLSYNKGDLETIYHVYPEVFSGTSLYPIGTDPCGNFICYDRDRNQYFIWNHETNSSERVEKLPFDI